MNSSIISRRSFLSAIAAVGALGITASNPVTASAVPSEDIKSVFVSDAVVSDKALALLDKVANIRDSFYFDENQRIATSLSNDDLVSVHGFTSEEVLFLNTSVIGRYVPESDEDVPTTRVHISGNRLYISHDDLTFGAFAAVALAASAGPAALAAAIAAAGTAIGGPVGALIGTIVGLIGVPSLAGLCTMIIWAVGNGQGIYIGIVPQVPPIEMGYW